MADSSKPEIEKLAPERLLDCFRRSGILLCIILAFALHVVVLGGTSVDYIHGLIDPAWQAEQDRLAEEARKKARAEKLPADRPAKAAKTPTTTTAPAQPPEKPAGGGKPKLPENLTTMPKPGELPDAPGSGIGLDETEGR